MYMHATTCDGTLPKALIRKLIFIVSGHCRYATALHGQCRGRTASQHQHSRDSQALHSGETVRELLTHSDNDPLQQRTISVSVAGPPASCGRVVCRRSRRYNALSTGGAGAGDVPCPRIATRTRRHAYALRRQ